jgi:hypothetical protein
LLVQKRGGFSKRELENLFDIVDLEPSGQRWFGQLLNAPNRNMMFEGGSGPLNRWMREILFSGRAFKEALDVCSSSLKVKGAAKGLATLLLYLADPLAYNVCVPATEEALEILGRIPKRRSQRWGESYAQFNEAALGFRDRFGLQPQEVDWALSLIQKHVKADKGHFLIEADWTDEPRDKTATSPSDFAVGPAPRRRSIINRISRDTAVAQAVKRMYRHRCQVCGLLLETPEGPYAEAAHIHPLGSPHDGPDVPENVLCLCPTHHVLFDAGVFSVRDDLTFLPRTDLNPPGLGPRLHQVLGHNIGAVYLAHHRQQFGFTV